MAIYTIQDFFINGMAPRRCIPKYTLPQMKWRIGESKEVIKLKPLIPIVEKLVLRFVMMWNFQSSVALWLIRECNYSLSLVLQILKMAIQVLKGVRKVGQ